MTKAIRFLTSGGSEGAGIVEALGARVSGLKVGDRICYFGLTGSYCEGWLAY